MTRPMRRLVSNISNLAIDLRYFPKLRPDLRLLRSVALAKVGRLRTWCGLNADRRPHPIDICAAALPAMLLLAFIDYTAWCAWWI